LQVSKSMLPSRPDSSRGTGRLILILGALAIVVIFIIGAIIVYLVRPIIPPYLLDTVVYASLFGLMAMGLTLTYLTTKVPNFAYGSFVTVGIYTSFSLLRVNHINPYVSAPIAFVLGGVSSVVMYLGVLRVLARRGSSLVALMISTLAIDIAFIGIFGIYSDYLTSLYKIIDTKYFVALSATPGTDFSLFGLPGLLFVAPLSLAAVTLALYLLLTKTRFGIAMRASVENPSLARVLGIDVERTYVFAWWLAGGFAALSGSYYSLWLPGGTSAGSNLIVEVFAASVLGGLASIYGAALGGLIVGASEILLTQEGAQLFGSWVQIYQKGVPLVIMVVTLLLFPHGLVSVGWRRIVSPVAQTIRRVAVWLGQTLRVGGES
jgi:branched-chain amino acid transport system permease protein